MLRLFLFISAPAIVAPFTHRTSPSPHPTITTPWPCWSSSYRRHHMSTTPPPLHATAGRGANNSNNNRRDGAMARRDKKKKNSTIRIEDDDVVIVGSSVDDDDDDGVIFDRRTTDDDDHHPTKSSSSKSSLSSSDIDIDIDEDENIYSIPPLYDLAFGYRDYVAEVDFLLRAHAVHSSIEIISSSFDSSSSTTTTTPPPLRLLELAAGPARHSLAALTDYPKSKVDSVMALDISMAMVEYGMKNADIDLLGKNAASSSSGGGGSSSRRDDFRYDHGDMRYFGNDYYEEGSFDAAWLLLGSMQHLLSNDDIIACLSSLRYVIKSGGTVVIELPHPRETFRMGECTTNGWTVPLVEEDDVVDGGGGGEREYGELSIVWGEEGDVFDPVSQIRNFSIGLELRVNDVNDIIPKKDDDEDGASSSLLFKKMKANGKTKLRQVVPLRLFTMQEIDALSRIAGFELVARYGALDEDVSIDDEDEAFRMVCVLRKKAE